MRKKQKFEEFDSTTRDSNYFDRKLRSKNKTNARFTSEIVDINNANNDKHYDVDELTDKCYSEITDEFVSDSDENSNDPDYNQRTSDKYDLKRKSPPCMSTIFVRQFDCESYDTLELPPGASDLLLTLHATWSAVAIYEVLYQFSNVLRLSSFRFENFCAALLVKENAKLLAECHMSLLKCILKEDEQSGVALTTKECKDSVSISLYCLDDMTWYEAVCMYLESISRSDVIKFQNPHNYYCLDVENKIVLLQTLIDLFLCTTFARDILFRENDLVHEEHCRSCHKKFNINRRGNLLCCESCPAMYHLTCIDPPLDTIPSGDWYCLACHKHKVAEIEDSNCACMRNQLSSGRREPLGFDRHGRRYWHLCRRIFVEDDDRLLAYYSSETQLEELLSKFDVQSLERSLFESFAACKEEIIGDMKVTESLTEKFKDHRKTRLSQDDEKVIERKNNQVNVVFDEGRNTPKADTDCKEIATKGAQISQDAFFPWSSEPFYKLGMEGNFRNYSNVYNTEVLALGRSQQVEERERRRHLSYKFSLTGVAEFGWICPKAAGKFGTNGGHEAILEILRKTIINLQASIPRSFMHANWILHSSKWLKAISKCSTAREFSLILMIFEACIRPMVFNNVWHQALGHTTLQRITAAEVEEGKKREKEVRSSLKEEINLNAERVKHSLGVCHSIWKQRGEEYRLIGRHSWYWVSPVRSVRISRRSSYLRSMGVMFLNRLLQARLQLEERVNVLLKRLKEATEGAPEVQHKKDACKNVPPSITLPENGHENGASFKEEESEKVILDEPNNGLKVDESISNLHPSISLNEMAEKIEEALKVKSFTSKLEGMLEKVHSSKFKVSLKKLLPPRKVKSTNGGLPMAHYFEVRKQKKRTSIFVLDGEKLHRLARKAGSIEVPGFIYSSSGSFCPSVDRALREIHPGTSRFVGCPRANFQTAWRYRTRMTSNLSCLALQLRILHCCIRWDDLYAPYPSDGVLVVDGAEHGTDDVTTYEMLERRIVRPGPDPVDYRVEYLVRKKVVPKESSQPLPPSTGERSTQRTGLRERRVVEPTISEELIPEEDMELWQIKYFADMNEKEPNSKNHSEKRLQKASSSMPSPAPRSTPRPHTPTTATASAATASVSATACQTPPTCRVSSQTQSKLKASLVTHCSSDASSSPKLSIEDELKKKRLEMQQKRFGSACLSPVIAPPHGARELPIKVFQQNDTSDAIQSKPGIRVSELLKHISVVKGPDGKLEVLGLREGQEAVHLPGGKIKIILSPSHAPNQSQDDEQTSHKASNPKQSERTERVEPSSEKFAGPITPICGSKENKNKVKIVSRSVAKSDKEKLQIVPQEREAGMSEPTTGIPTGLKKVSTPNSKSRRKKHKSPKGDFDAESCVVNFSSNGILMPSVDDVASRNIPKNRKTETEAESSRCGSSEVASSSASISQKPSQPSRSFSPCSSLKVTGQVSSVNTVKRKVASIEDSNGRENVEMDDDDDDDDDDDAGKPPDVSKWAKKRKRDSIEDLQPAPKKTMKMAKLSNGDKLSNEEDAKLHCLCRMPYDDTKFYVGCNSCGEWYHGGCVGLTPEAAASRDKYICELCRRHSPNQLHCVCRTPYDETKFYIGCDECLGWFHGDCVGILASEAQKLESFKCQSCRSGTAKAEERSVKEELNLKIAQLLKELKDLPVSQAFLDDSMPKNQRGFKFIEEKLLIRSYKSIDEFVEDFESFLSDLRHYSLKQSDDYKNANKLQSNFLSKLIKLRKTL